MSGADAIVIGAGANGLAAATLLARRGRRVVVLERREIAGGLAASEEFHRGYRGAGMSCDTTGLAPDLAEELGLAAHGLRMRARRPALLALGAAGDALWLDGAAGVRSPRDAERWAAWRSFVEVARPALTRWAERPALDVVGLERLGELLGFAIALRRAGRDRLRELLRVPPLPAADWLREWFEDDVLRAALALDAVRGTVSGPRAPGSAFNLLLHEATASPGVEGGAPALVAALESAARAAGAELRLGSEATRIVVAEGAVRGVELADGATLAARAVVATCDPRRALLGLVPALVLGRRATANAASYRMRGQLAHVQLALDRPPAFPAGSGGPPLHVRIAAGLDAVERAYDAAKYREVSAEPVLEVHVPTVERPELAPPGHAVVSALVHCAPYDLAGGFSDERREALGRRTIEILERHAPGLARSVVGQRVLGPRDLESRFAVTGGHLDHGERGLDQLLVRPTPECLRQATPVPGLFLGGAGTHPGSGFPCRPGALAAAAVLAAS